MKRTVLPYLLILPALVAIGGLFAFPFFYNVYLSLNNWSRGLRQPVFSGLHNYSVALGSDQFWNAVRVSFTFTGATVILQFGIGLVTALLIDSFSYGKKLLRVLILIPMAITPIVSSLTWKTLIYDVTFGIANYFLSLIGIDPVTWLAGSGIAMVALVIMQVWHWTPFLTIIFIAGLSSLPRECFESAYVDGASPLQIFRSITFPLLIPVTFAGVIFRTIDAFRTFDTIFALTGGGPGTATQALPLYIFQLSFQYFRVGTGAAASFLMVIMALCVVSVLFSILRYLRRDI